MGFATAEMQREFWTGFADALTGTGFEIRRVTTKNYVYLATGTSEATIVVVAPTEDGGIACKLKLNVAATRSEVYQRLHRDRAAVESELGFPLAWGNRGTGRSSTRIYLLCSESVLERDKWSDAFAWLAESAVAFREVFVPRIRGTSSSLNGSDAINGFQLEPGSDTSEMPSSNSPAGAPRPSTPTTTAAQDDFLAAIDGLGAWSEWIPLPEARAKAPDRAGVYMARVGPAGPIIYVGMAGERADGGRPRGIRRRLNAYHSGKGLVSGLGEAALDRALADPAWLAERSAELERGTPRRAKDWGKEAIVRAELHVRWLVCEDRASALLMEQEVQRRLANTGLWNRRT
jgi:hypothetical protein